MPNPDDIETVQCEFCKRPTRNLRKERCHWCWEVLYVLVYKSLDEIELIIASARPELLQKIRAEGFRSGSDDERQRASVRPGHGDMGG